MRLRRETGDWTIKFSRIAPSESAYQLKTEQLPTGLSAEDFVGTVLELADYERVSGSDGITPISKTLAPITTPVIEHVATDYNIHYVELHFTVDSNLGIGLFYNPENGKLSNDYDSIKDKDESSDDSGSGGGTAGK